VPDYVVPIGTFEVSLEVKRPASSAGLLPAIEEASGQIKDFPASFGAIVLDITDVLGTQFLHDHTPEQVEQLFTGQFRDEVKTAREYLLGRKEDPGFSRVALLMLYALVMYWPPEEAAAPLAMFQAYPEVFHHVASGLVLEPAKRLRKVLVEGLLAQGGSIRYITPA
jgi:hypothetical protein